MRNTILSETKTPLLIDMSLDVMYDIADTTEERMKKSTVMNFYPKYFYYIKHLKLYKNNLYMNVNSCLTRSLVV